MDYKVLYIDGLQGEKCKSEIRNALEKIDGVEQITFCENYTEVYLDKDVEDEVLKNSVENCGEYRVLKVD